MAAAVVAAGLGFWIRFGSIPHHAWAYVIGSAFFPAIWLLVLMFARAYESRYLFVGNEEYRRVLNAGLVLTAAVAFVSYVASIELARLRRRCSARGYRRNSGWSLSFAALARTRARPRPLHAPRHCGGRRHHGR
ncbi:hypothetical protein [Fodinicola feengrottensis]|uniref:hypothetical protein n=1 Tax=Fodinicola feengrottensis TaxID=435914 RepID=UPI002441F60B|nr:hypothetical protein [Fodinicola feengrottensis]